MILLIHPANIIDLVGHPACNLTLNDQMIAPDKEVMSRRYTASKPCLLQCSAATVLSTLYLTYTKYTYYHSSLSLSQSDLFVVQSVRIESVPDSLLLAIQENPC